jgi:hypothetical protein
VDLEHQSSKPLDLLVGLGPLALSLPLKRLLLL